MKLLFLSALTAALMLVSAAAPAAGPPGAAIFTARPNSGFKDGGHIVVTKQIRDRHGKVVGWGNTVCFDLHNSSAECVGTFVLPLGRIMVAGTRHNQDFWTFAIVGGTGFYEAAGGTLIANTIQSNPRVERLVFFFS